MSTISPAWERRDPETVRVYADLLERAIGETEVLRDIWAARGPEAADPAERLLRFLREQADRAAAGELPSRELGFALTRFMDDYEWRPDGAEVRQLVLQLADVWRGGA